MPGIRFGEALQPEELTRLTEGVIALVQGTLAGRGRIAWTGNGKVTSTGDFSTANMDLAAPFGPITGMSGTIHFSDLLGLETPPGQVMAIKGVDGFDRTTPVAGPTNIEARQGAKRSRGGARLWTIAVAVFKSELYRFLRQDRAPAIVRLAPHHVLFALVPLTPGDLAAGEPMPPLIHTLRFDDAVHHYVEVETRVPSEGRSAVELSMAVWTPGSYLVREYARHVEDLTAATPGGEPLAAEKVTKNRWRLATGDGDEVVVSYRVYCREMTVRTNFVDASFALLNGAPTFFALEVRPEATAEQTARLTAWLGEETPPAGGP